MAGSKGRGREEGRANEKEQRGMREGGEGTGGGRHKAGTVCVCQVCISGVQDYFRNACIVWLFVLYTNHTMLFTCKPIRCSAAEPSYYILDPVET